MIKPDDVPNLSPGASDGPPVPEITDIDRLLAVADAYARFLGLAESTVSKRVFADHRRLASLRAATSDVGVRRCREALVWLSANWPTGADWPTEVPRPSPDLLPDQSAIAAPSFIGRAGARETSAAGASNTEPAGVV